MAFTLTYSPANAFHAEGIIVRDGQTRIYRRHGAHDWQRWNGWPLDPALVSAAEYLSWKYDGEAFAAVHRQAEARCLDCGGKLTAHYSDCGGQVAPSGRL